MLRSSTHQSRNSLLSTEVDVRLRSATWLRDEVETLPDWVVGIDGTRSVGKSRNQPNQVPWWMGPSRSMDMFWLTGSLKPIIHKSLT